MLYVLFCLGLSAMNMSASTSSAGDRPMNRCDNEMYGTYRGTRRQDYGNDYGADTRTQGAYIPMEDSSGNYEQDGTRRSLTDGAVQFFHRYGNARSNTTTRRPWKVGDKCLAPWNDGQVNFDRLKDRSEVKAPVRSRREGGWNFLSLLPLPIPPPPPIRKSAHQISK